MSARTESWEQPPSAPVRVMGMNQLRLWFAPEARLFVAKNLAVGMYVRLGVDLYERSDDIDFSANGFGGGALLAYRVELGTNTFLLPELGLGAVYYDRSVRDGSSSPFGRGTGLNFDRFRRLGLPRAVWDSATVLHASLYIPFGVVIAPRFYAGIGPYVRVEHANGAATPRGDDWNMSIGISTVLGTWL